ncbi:MAG: hypothetical protein ACE5H0_11280 [Bacteroidota bacterium]
MAKVSRKRGVEVADEQKTRGEIERILAGRHHLNAETSTVLQHLRQAKRLSEAQWQKFKTEVYEKKLLEHLEDSRPTELERKFLDDLAKPFHLSYEEVLRIRRAHAPEAIKKLFRHAFEDRYLSLQEKSELFQVGEYMGLTAEFVETFLAAQSKVRE